MELRALEVMDVLPAGCFEMLVEDVCSVPHLRPGEFAVIDPSDCEPQHG